MKKGIQLAPRDEHYQFNLANIYMVNHKMDEAIEMFRHLAGSPNPEVAMRANQALLQAQTFKEQSREYQLRLETRNEPSAPPLHQRPESKVSSEPEVSRTETAVQ